MKPNAYRFDSKRELELLEIAYPKDFFTFLPKYASHGFIFDLSHKESWRIISGTWSSSSWGVSIKKGWNPISFEDAIKNAQFLKQNALTMNTKIGTVVKCIKPLGSSFLQKDQTYKIVSVNQHSNIQIQELGNDPKTSAHWYMPSRFEEVSKAAAVTAVAANNVSASKQYKTRNGLAVSLYTIHGHGDYPVVGSVTESDGSFSNVEWTKNGGFYGDGASDNYDLVEVVPVPHNIPVTVSAGSGQHIAVVYQTYVKFYATNLTFAQMEKVNQVVAEMQKALAKKG